MKKKISQILILMSIAGIAMLFVMGVKLNKRSLFELIKERRVQNDELVVNLELNDMVPGTDAYMHRYTFPVRTEDEGKCIFLYAEAWDSEGNPLQTVIDDTKKNQCVKVSFDKEVEILVYSDREYYEGTIRFTNLPVISLNSYDGEVDEFFRMHNYADAYIIDPYFENRSDYYIESDSEFFKRGTTAYDLDKPSFKFGLKKINSNQTRLNRSKPLLGMRDDDDWVLDAAYTDPSRIRNKLACDLWNRIVDTSSSTFSSYLRGEFVELYIESSFYGLYILKEPVDKKTAMIEEQDILYKATMLTEVTQGQVRFDYPAESVWEGYEIEYPESMEYFQYWEKLMNHYNQINSINGNSLDDYDIFFDIDNLIDYFIFINITSANDNSGKNLFITYFDVENKISITPWDLDLSFGLFYNEFETKKSEKFMDNYEETKTFYPFNVLELNCNEEINELIAQRWIELRNGVFSNVELNQMIDEILLLLNSGFILEKESSRWDNLDHVNEIEEISAWLKKRVKFLDEYFLK